MTVGWRSDLEGIPTLREWMSTITAEMKEKGLTWISCKFRTDDQGRFEYTEVWK